MVVEHYSNQRKALFSLFGVLLLVGIAFVLWPKTAKEPDYTQCTQEAKLCPDGSYVGRTGPNCEFATCPEVVDSPAPPEDGWEIATDNDLGVTFKYPEVLASKYITAAEWPPIVNLFDGPLGCTSGGNENRKGGSVEKRMVDDRTYCVTTQSEGAAGSVYTTYTYVGEQKKNKLIAFTFSLRAVQCLNYDDPQKTECLAERESFDVDGLVDRMTKTVVVQP
ncbi:MAG: hypothetical protein WC052_02945 [Patescibacteria group bacterium]